MPTGSWRCLVACAAAALLTMTGCSSSDDTPSSDEGASPTPAETVTVTETVTPTPTPTPTTPPPTPADPVPAIDGPVVEQGQIISPSGNIRCSLDYGVECSVTQSSYEALPEEDCDLDWVDNQFYIGESSGARGVCRGDTPFTADPAVLAYGSTSVVAGEACKSTETAMICWSTGSGHGFRISRASYDLF